MLSNSHDGNFRWTFNFAASLFVTFVCFFSIIFTTFFSSILSFVIILLKQTVWHWCEKVAAHTCMTWTRTYTHQHTCKHTYLYSNTRKRCHLAALTCADVRQVWVASNWKFIWQYPWFGCENFVLLFGGQRRAEHTNNKKHHKQVSTKTKKY